jgi:acetylornithine deacetylase/succinyl-diaminopimelate desuccinylase-like protein
MVGILKNTVRDLGWKEPASAVSLGASDCKHWRQHGVPSYIYGCRPTNMAKPDEWVDVDEFLHIVRTHALAALAYLSA